MPGTEIDYPQVGAALVLVAVAVALSVWQRVRLEADIMLAAFRAFVQLIALGYVIDAIFSADSIVWTVALLGVMVGFGAFTARGRARRVPSALPILIFALGVSATATVGLALALDVIDATPRTMIPLGGMMIGNAMTGAAVALDRLADEIVGSRSELEARLALGATAQQAVMPVVRRSLRSGMINVIDSTKTAGLVFIPGTMLGMLLAGAEPLDAVRLQAVLFYLLLGSVSISVVLAATLAARRFFTPAHQVREVAAL